MILRLEPVLRLSDDQLLELCRLNRDLRIERTSQGDLAIMTPAGAGSGRRNSEILFQLESWARKDGTGVVFSASAGFLLPDGSMRAPDAAWVLRSRLMELSPEQKEKFLPLCPDFVVELLSPTDRLAATQRKMEEYLAHNAQLGWLINPLERKVYIYSPGRALRVLEEPASVSGDPVLPGFRLELGGIWELGW